MRLVREPIGCAAPTLHRRCSRSGPAPQLRSAMKKAVRSKAVELLGFGMPKQAVFDTLVLEHPEAKPKRIAEMLRYMPTLHARERYRNQHLALLCIIGASALLRVLPRLLNQEVRMDQATAYLSLIPIATLLVGWSIYRWQGQVFEWVGWGNVLSATGLMGALGRLAKGEAEIGSVTMNVLSVCIGVLTLYLAHRVFKKPQVEKDPLGNGPPRYFFHDELA